MITTVIYAIVAYFIGNVMGGKLLEKIYKEEFTNKGSGNVGARNAGRVLGPRSFLFVLAVDFFKGFFVRYYQEKNKLLIKTNKVLNLLKYEFTMYTVAVLTIYSTSSFSFIRKIKSVEYAYIACGIFVALLLLTGVINIKRTLLIRKELRNNNSK